jgi:hypothetical protein
MHSKYYLFALIIFSGILAKAQLMTWEWATNAGYISDNFAIGDDCLNIFDNCTDSQGNVYITGDFHGEIDFGLYLLQQNDCNTYDNCFITKYSPAGISQWSYEIEYSNSLYGWAASRTVFTDSHNNVYMTGIFQGYIFVNNQPLSTNGNNDIFIIKFNPEGIILWVKKIGGQGSDETKKNCAFADINDNIYISGNYNSSTLDFGNITINNYSGNSDIFIASLDTTGELNWVNHYGGPGSESVECIGGNDYRILLAGSTSNPGFQIGSYNVSSTCFLTSLDDSGNTVWVKNFPGVHFKSFGLKTDNTQNIYLAADYGGSLLIDNVAFNSGNNFSGNIFILKLTPSGQPIYGNSLSLSPQYYSYYYDIDVDDSANVYVETPFFNICFDSISINSNNCNIIIVKYDSSLVYKNYLRTYTDLYSFNSCFSIDPYNNIYLCGEFFGHYIIAGEDTIQTGTSPNIWFANIFLAKINCSGSIHQQRINLQIGWSLISSFIDPFEQGMNLVFDNISNNLQIVKNEVGQLYWPQYGINTIGDYNVLEGYQIKMSAPDTLTLTGLAVTPEITPLYINTNWHLISYLRKTPAPIINMLGSISSCVIIVKNGNGMVFWPNYNINTVGDMIPGQGYQIKLITPATLFYPPN